VRIRCREGPAADDLIAFFRRCECAAERIGDGVVEVSPRSSPVPDVARLQVEGLLRVWQKLHPEASAGVALLRREAASGEAMPRGSADVHGLLGRIDDLVVERQALRANGADPHSLERNRLEIAACERELSLALRTLYADRGASP